MSFQQCRFNFGSEEFKYPPKRPFSVFNDVGDMKPQDKVTSKIVFLVENLKNFPFQIVLPRHLYLEELRKEDVTEDSCQLCFDSIASIRLIPCQHTGFCSNCSKQLKTCPICRSEIVRVEVMPETFNTEPDES